MLHPRGLRKRLGNVCGVITHECVRASRSLVVLSTRGRGRPKDDVSGDRIRTGDQWIKLMGLSDSHHHAWTHKRRNGVRGIGRGDTLGTGEAVSGGRCPCPLPAPTWAGAASGHVQAPWVSYEIRDIQLLEDHGRFWPMPGNRSTDSRQGHGRPGCPALPSWVMPCQGLKQRLPLGGQAGSEDCQPQPALKLARCHRLSRVVSLQIHVHPDPRDGALLGNEAFADVTS